MACKDASIGLGTNDYNYRYRIAGIATRNIIYCIMFYCSMIRVTSLPLLIDQQSQYARRKVLLPENKSDHATNLTPRSSPLEKSSEQPSEARDNKPLLVCTHRANVYRAFIPPDAASAAVVSETRLGQRVPRLLRLGVENNILLRGVNHVASLSLSLSLSSSLRQREETDWRYTDCKIYTRTGRYRVPYRYKTRLEKAGLRNRGLIYVQVNFLLSISRIDEDFAEFPAARGHRKDYRVLELETSKELICTCHK